MGVGSNRINVYTIGMATQGLANYLKASFPNQEISIAVTNDSRLNNTLFCRYNGKCNDGKWYKGKVFQGNAPNANAFFCHQTFWL